MSVVLSALIPLECLLPQYYSRAVSPYGTFIVCTDRPVQAAWQQYRLIIPVSSAETASYKLRRVYLRRTCFDRGAVCANYTITQPLDTDIKLIVT